MLGGGSAGSAGRLGGWILGVFLHTQPTIYQLHPKTAPITPTPQRLAATPEEIGMATGATIHTANGMMVSVARRQGAAAGSQQRQSQPAAAV